MTKPQHVENRARIRQLQRKLRGIEAEQLPQLNARERRAADQGGVHTAAFRVCDLPQPCSRVLPQRRRRVCGGDNASERIEAERSLTFIARGVLLAGACNRLQIRHVRAPHSHSRLGAAAGAGKIRRIDEFSVIAQHLVCRLRYGLRGFFHGCFIVRAEFFAQRILAQPRLAACAVGADVRICMLFARSLLPQKRPRGHGLRLECLGRKRHGHLAQHNACQIVPHTGGERLATAKKLQLRSVACNRLFFVCFLRRGRRRRAFRLRLPQLRDEKHLRLRRLRNLRLRSGRWDQKNGKQRQHAPDQNRFHCNASFVFRQVYAARQAVMNFT